MTFLPNVHVPDNEGLFFGNVVVVAKNVTTGTVFAEGDLVQFDLARTQTLVTTANDPSLVYGKNNSVWTSIRGPSAGQVTHGFFGVALEAISTGEAEGRVLIQGKTDKLLVTPNTTGTTGSGSRVEATTGGAVANFAAGSTAKYVGMLLENMTASTGAQASTVLFDGINGFK